ncbi:hypothetical protein MRB53_041347 [Persea americana]|nr:hypothetical protein MRB53_041347 [Persea americana]
MGRRATQTTKTMHVGECSTIIRSELAAEMSPSTLKCSSFLPPALPDAPRSPSSSDASSIVSPSISIPLVSLLPGIRAVLVSPRRRGSPFWQDNHSLVWLARFDHARLLAGFDGSRWLRASTARALTRCPIQSDGGALQDIFFRPPCI